MTELITGEVGAWFFSGANVSDERIASLSRAVRTSFGDADRQQLREAVREYVSETRFGGPGAYGSARRKKLKAQLGDGGEKTQTHRHKKMAELSDELIELMRQERTIGGPMDTSLAAKLASLELAIPLPTWERSFRILAAAARHQTCPSERSSNEDPRINPHFNRLIVRVAETCKGAQGVPYGKPRGVWNGLNQSRASALAQGIVELLADLPDDVAMNRSPSALAEYIHPHKLLHGKQSGQKHRKPSRKKTASALVR